MSEDRERPDEENHDIHKMNQKLMKQLGQAGEEVGNPENERTDKLNDATKTLMEQRRLLWTLKDKDGKEERDIEKITHIVEEFYKDLYTSEKKPSDESRENIKREIKNVNSEELPEIEDYDIEEA
ncbi:hypothetical protein HHI36_004028 [Cryptolaemus montrouzieri]|uniref:Uncharacterized protein n=1 Tax=Cryptolaemus montrouzieri TaxID=559131 RepID=A0ABD2NQZ4_9CUCU